MRPEEVQELFSTPERMKILSELAAGGGFTVSSMAVKAKLNPGMVSIYFRKLCGCGALKRAGGLHEMDFSHPVARAVAILLGDPPGSAYRKRAPAPRKGDFGRVLVIGGSLKYSGAPALNALAALRAGADIAVVFAPRRAADIVASFSPDLITEPQKCDFLSMENLAGALAAAKPADAVVIGGGLGRKPATLAFVSAFLKKFGKPCVVDADGLYAKIPAGHLLTPHAGEFKHLFGFPPREDAGKRAEVVRKLAARMGSAVFLKGRFGVVSDGSVVRRTPAVSAYLTKGGTGDLLAGICAAMLARGLPAMQAAEKAAAISAAAGETAAQKYGESTLASDIINEIATAIKSKENQK